MEEREIPFEDLPDINFSSGSRDEALWLQGGAHLSGQGTTTHVAAQLALAYAASAEALIRECSEALRDGVDVVCRASFGILRPALAPLKGYCRVADRSNGRAGGVDEDGSARVNVCVKLIDSRGDITMNGVLEWTLTGSADRETGKTGRQDR